MSDSCRKSYMPSTEAPSRKGKMRGNWVTVAVRVIETASTEAPSRKGNMRGNWVTVAVGVIETPSTEASSRER